MSACLKGHFHEEFVNAPKILVLISESKPLHYMPRFFSVCVRVCLCNIYGFGYSHKYCFPFFNVGNPMPLRNLQGQIDGQTPQQMEMFNKFLYPLERLTTDVSYAETSAKSLFVHGEMLFFLYETFH